MLNGNTVTEEMTEACEVAAVAAVAVVVVAAGNGDVDIGSLSMKFQEQLDQQRHPCTLESIQDWNSWFHVQV